MTEPMAPSWEDTVRSAMADVPRLLGDTGARENGPLLFVLGGLHGNEPAGVLALQRIFTRLEQDTGGLRGRLIGLAGNRQALAAGERFLDEDLNRMWLSEVFDRLRDTAVPRARELAEIEEILAHLDVLSAYPRNRAFLLDVHSTSGGGSAFTSLDDTLANRALAFEIPVPHVLGLEEELAGTLVSYLNELGIPAIGFESGQHLDPHSVDRAESAIWIAMEASGVLARGARTEVRRARELLQAETLTLPNVVEVLHRHPVEPEDGFVMLPGFENFQPVEKGQLLARDARGTLEATHDGMLLMPLYQGQGEDGYFVVRPVDYAWLKVSAGLRRLRADRLLHWLPGVRRAPEGRDTYVVDLHRARLKALQIFHLLGYRRVARTEDTLLMRKRDAGNGD